MHLYEIPLIFVLIGLVLYVVLAGADFGAGFWQLLAGPHGERVRNHAHDSIGPVWEANHVWLIFVLTVTWTAYPTAFGAIASTLCIPLFIAALGIVMRGATYALRAGAQSSRELRPIDLVFALSSVITPFALGTVVGAIAARQVPVGNAAGALFGSWTGATPLIVGALAVATSAYLAAVFMAADAQRLERASHDRDDARSLDERPLIDGLRTRALIAGLIAGAVALAGLFVLHADAHFLYARLLRGSALAVVIVSALAGVATLALVAANRFELARFSAAAAVAAIVAAWALAQRPVLLKGLTVQQAAAPRDTLVLIVVAVLGGALILFPSLALLFRLVLQGRLDHADGANDDAAGAAAAASPVRTRESLDRLIAVSRDGLLARAAGVCLLAGFGFLTVAESGWAHAIGVVALLGFLIVGFLAVVPAQLADFERDAAVKGDTGAPGTER
ncbi:MAG TPA: cytochrome d ubiquinol oxidase subunit II [Solirubrobacteraceae bacterium]|jgi:cytochrome d ubiquinol oxidase subunit II|nr:cytochrome d ubiquinol oxidase subunit II [Solirubrobacteraceae bacterium]